MAPRKLTQLFTKINKIGAAAGSTIVLGAALAGCGGKVPGETADYMQVTPSTSPGDRSSTTDAPVPAKPVPAKPVRPKRAPTPEEINRAISKLQGMNPSDILEFPLEKDPNYSIIGFRGEDNQYYGLTAKNVEEFLQESLKVNGKFPETSKVELIVRNQSTQKRLVLKPLSKNVPLENFVRAIDKM